MSVDRILTTHVGSLPRPRDLLDLMKAKLSGAAHDKAAYDARVKKKTDPRQNKRSF